MEIATLELTAYQAVAVAAIVLLLGRFLCSKISFLNTYCIPAPVVGGLVFAIVNLIGYTTGIGYIYLSAQLQQHFGDLPALGLASLRQFFPADKPQGRGVCIGFEVNIRPQLQQKHHQ